MSSRTSVSGSTRSPATLFWTTSVVHCIMRLWSRIVSHGANPGQLQWEIQGWRIEVDCLVISFHAMTKPSGTSSPKTAWRRIHNSQILGKCREQLAFKQIDDHRGNVYLYLAGNGSCKAMRRLLPALIYRMRNKSRASGVGTRTFLTERVKLSHVSILLWHKG